MSSMGPATQPHHATALGRPAERGGEQQSHTGMRHLAVAAAAAAPANSTRAVTCCGACWLDRDAAHPARQRPRLRRTRVLSEGRGEGEAGHAAAGAQRVGRYWTAAAGEGKQAARRGYTYDGQQRSCRQREAHGAMLQGGETGQGNLATASGAAAAGTAKGDVTYRRRRQGRQAPPSLLATNPRPRWAPMRAPTRTRLVIRCDVVGAERGPQFDRAGSHGGVRSRKAPPCKLACEQSGCLSRRPVSRGPSVAGTARLQKPGPPRPPSSSIATRTTGCKHGGGPPATCSLQ